MSVASARVLAASLCLAMTLAMTLAMARASFADASSARTTRLPSGLTLVVEHDATQPIVAAALAVRIDAGRRASYPAGLAHLAEHLVYRGGSLAQAPLAYRRTLRQLGEESGGYTTAEYTNYGFTVPTENFEDALRLSIDAWLSLEITPARFEAERRVVRSEFRSLGGTPERELHALLRRTTEPYGGDVSLDAVQLETVRRFYDEFYAPAGMTLAIVGDIDTTRVALQVEEWVRATASGRKRLPDRASPPPQVERSTTARSVETPLAMAETRLLLEFPISSADAADLPALELVVELLASDESARLPRAFAARRVDVGAIEVRVEAATEGGYLTFDLALDRTAVEPALSALSREVTRLMDEAPLADELTRAKSSWLGRRARAQQSFFERAQARSIAVLRGDTTAGRDDLARIDAVTRDGLSRAVRRHLGAARMNIAVGRPLSAAPALPSIALENWPRPEASGERSIESPPPAPASTSAQPSLAELREPSSRTRVELDNDTVLWIEVDPAASVVGAVVRLEGGRAAAPAGREGLAEVSARLLMRGALGRGGVDLAQRSAELGAELRTYGEAEEIRVTLEGLATLHRPALQLLADVVTAPTFPLEEQLRVRGGLQRERARWGERPREFVRARLDAALEDAELGSALSIGAITEIDLREFWRRHLVGARMTICVVGPVDPVWVERWARERFGGLSRGERAAPKPREEAVGILEERWSSPQHRMIFEMGWRAPGIAAPDYLSLSLGVSAIGERLFFDAVYGRGIAYRFALELIDGPAASASRLEMEVAPESYSEIAADLVAQFQQFSSTPLPEAEIDAARRRVAVRYRLGTQTPLARAQRISLAERAGLGSEEPARTHALATVPSARVQEAIRQYLSADRYARVALGPLPGAPPVPSQ